jgi:hypothetical protein
MTDFILQPFSYLINGMSSLKYCLPHKINTSAVYFQTEGHTENVNSHGVLLYFKEILNNPSKKNLFLDYYQKPAKEG